MTLYDDIIGYFQSLAAKTEKSLTPAGLSALIYFANRQSIRETLYPLCDEDYVFENGVIKGSVTWDKITGATPTEDHVFLSEHNRWIAEMLYHSMGHLDDAMFARNLRAQREIKDGASITYLDILKALNIGDADVIAQDYASLREAQNLLSSL